MNRDRLWNIAAALLGVVIIFILVQAYLRAEDVARRCEEYAEKVRGRPDEVVTYCPYD